MKPGWRGIYLAYGAALLSVQLVTSTALAASNEKLPLAFDPPQTKSVAVTLLDKPTTEGNARLDVQYLKDPRLTTKIQIYLDQKTVILHDDGINGDALAGDLKYSAIVPLDIKAITANQQRVLNLQSQQNKSLTMPVYSRRHKVTEIALPVDYFRPYQTGISHYIDYVGLLPGVQTEKSLLIRDPRVVGNPARTYDTCSDTGTRNGKWTFGYLMTQIANPAVTGIDPTEFVTQWINQNLSTQIVNGWSVPGTSELQSVVDIWPRLPDGRLDISRAPFKLIAIVNRVDLRKNPVYGSGDAGEARFVFQVNCVDGVAARSHYHTVILEYGISRPSCGSVRSWAQQWAGLSAYSLGSAEYLSALEAMTDQFSSANAAPLKPNGSAINQVRMNITPAGSWELREFHLQGTGSAVRLKLATVAQTPDSFTADADAPPERAMTPTAFSDYVNEFQDAIVNSRYTVPLEYHKSHLLGGNSDGASRLGVNPWNNALILNREARHSFALQTCNGCHSTETGLGRGEDFFHIQDFGPGSPAHLSGFMTGIDVPDPFDGTPTRHFNELERRSVDLDALANNQCLYMLNNNVNIGDMLRPILGSH